MCPMHFPEEAEPQAASGQDRGKGSHSVNDSDIVAASKWTPAARVGAALALATATATSRGVQALVTL